MRKIMLALTILFFGFSTYAQNTSTVINSYINLKNALVDSDSKGASEAAATFYQDIKKKENFTQKADLLKATEKLTSAGSGIDKQRAAFTEVSATMWKLVKDSDLTSEKVYYQYCPMKKAYWLSKEKEIKNPYYGSSMLTCGKVAEEKN